MHDTQLPDIKTQFPDWYNEIVYRAKLADQAPVRGCMVIMPYGQALWEQIRDELDAKIKRTGHSNAAFPLLIPESYLRREADHVAGFSPELAVVTHAGGEKLEEPLVVRPTSETIIHTMFARWMRSWRDLPLKINQWCSVVRWEKRSRPFLRTTEFWWQEGHTAHETEAEAYEEVMTMLNEYRDLAENYLAIPVVTGRKTPTEKFAGATLTTTIEGLMPDGKALQMGTSHLISQTFAHAFDMKFQNREGSMSYPFLTSWGATTRLIGALVMTHGDQKGLIIPPKVAPIQVVIIPILKGTDTSVKDAAHEIAKTLRQNGIRVHCDDRTEETPGAKFYEYELRGVPVRIEIGPRDLAQGVATIANRMTGAKATAPIAQLSTVIGALLQEIQQALFARARDRRAAQWFHAETAQEVAQKIEAQRGFYEVGWCGATECETAAKAFKASTRCMLETHNKKRCYACQKESMHDILLAQSY